MLNDKPIQLTLFYALLSQTSDTLSSNQQPTDDDNIGQGGVT